MKVEIKGGKILISSAALFDEMSKEELDEIIDYLACQEQIVAEVSKQIIEGYTSLGSYAYKDHSEPPHTALDKAVSFVAEHSSEAAKRQIEDLARRVEFAEDEMSKAWSEKIKAIEDLETLKRTFTKEN